MTDLATAIDGWAPEPVTTTGTTSAWSVAAVSGLFDLDPVAREGEPLPPMWHWFGFLDHPRQDQLGDDGHLDAGHFLPPMEQRRRMMAGGRLRIRTPMLVGETLTRRSSLVSAQVKHGRSGEMLLVTVRDEYRREGSDEPVVTDEADIVYRSQAPGQARGIGFDSPSDEPPATSAEAVELTPDATLLFRFSALTYNTHRIHYDEPYVTAVEGYPGLVVHGPLLALMLLEIPRRSRPARAVTGFDYRLSRPAFVGTRLVADHRDAPGDDELAVASGVPGTAPSVSGTITLG
ncbi:MaoC family dehydratase N-terminal domain-containing protein [Actinomycetospora endophytica]|uniref:MaoC family dehydratase N-terminal domain-containing protein n=1 Tax=Actinomycetospora endophytica TaxID=2291215 RepID=A0ABS8PGF4_9PSEU|nr:MaoC family dehydratase N-terminal domain-containing protein [Actinomycetospora endophytica]MCD2197098.1 MaoC family dehydratase N-terminal domain-containing protein [Actinomycetospora endophytica]